MLLIMFLDPESVVLKEIVRPFPLTSRLSWAPVLRELVVLGMFLMDLAVNSSAATTMVPATILKDNSIILVHSVRSPHTYSLDRTSFNHNGV